MILGLPHFSVHPAHALPKADSLFVCFDQGRILLAQQGAQLTLPLLSQVILPPNAELFELACTGETTLFSPPPTAPFTVTQAPGLCWCEINIYRTLPDDTAALITSCLHLWNWYQTNRFCGRCGATVAPDDVERALRCPQCGRMIFPTIAPAVIVAITCGDRILLARNRRNSFYGLVAGFVEVGETLEHALHREVLEETGLHISNLRYIGNQPWGAGGSHMFGFCANADDQEPIHIQESELSDVRWFDRSELEPREHAFSIAFELIERFRMGQL